MNYQLGAFDTLILVLYAVILVGMGIYFYEKAKHQSSLWLPGGEFLHGLPVLLL